MKEERACGSISPQIAISPIPTYLLLCQALLPDPSFVPSLFSGLLVPLYPSLLFDHLFYLWALAKTCYLLRCLIAPDSSLNLEGNIQVFKAKQDKNIPGLKKRIFQARGTGRSKSME
jgi:hypothetical protein